MEVLHAGGGIELRKNVQYPGHQANIMDVPKIRAELQG